MLHEHVGPSRPRATTWSPSQGWSSGSSGRQRRAGRLHQGKTQVRSRRATRSAIAGDTWSEVDQTQSARSITGVTTTSACGSPHQARTWSTDTRASPRSSRATGSSSPATADSGEVDVEHDLARPHGRGRSRVVGVGAEVEREWTASQVAHGLGASYVKRLGGPERRPLLGAGRHGSAEVERVGDVELGLTCMVPVKETSWSWRVTWRLSHDSAARRSTSSGMNRPMASLTARSSWAGLILWATAKPLV